VIKTSITRFTDWVAWEERDFAGLRIAESPTVITHGPPDFPVFSSVWQSHGNHLSC
jgi:hypothetical protein